eukprot:c25783_g1_i1 orf=2-202(-)
MLFSSSNQSAPLHLPALFFCGQHSIPPFFFPLPTASCARNFTGRQPVKHLTAGCLSPHVPSLSLSLS